MRPSAMAHSTTHHPHRPQHPHIPHRPDIVLATPGRLIDLLRNALGTSLDELEILVYIHTHIYILVRVALPPR